MSRPWTLAGRTIRPGNVGSGNRVYSLPPSGNRDILDNTLLERRRGSVKLTSHGIAGRLHPFRDIGRDVVGTFVCPQRLASGETTPDDGPTQQRTAFAQKPPARCHANIVIDVGWLGHRASFVPGGFPAWFWHQHPWPRGTRAARQLLQADPRITLQKLPRLKAGSFSASTSALTLPNVVSGLCLMPS